MNKEHTLYDILQVSENASDEVIKAAYLSLIKKYHPDSNPAFRKEATEITALLNHAYSVLSDPKKRQEYNASLHPNPAKATHIHYSQTASARQSSSPKSPPPPKPDYSDLKVEDGTWTFRAKVFIGCVIALIAYLVITVISSLHEPPVSETLAEASTQAETALPVTQAETPTTQARKHAPPSHGSIIFGNSYVTYGEDYFDGRDIYAPLEIVPPTDNMYYCVKFTSTTTDQEYMFFVKGGQRAIEYNLLCDTYVVTLATGHTWYGIKNLFGEETQYYKFDEFFDFYHDNDHVWGCTLTLYETVDGNLTKTTISADEF